MRGAGASREVRRLDGKDETQAHADELARRAVNADDTVICEAANQFAVILLDVRARDRTLGPDERLAAGLRRLPRRRSPLRDCSR